MLTLLTWPNSLTSSLSNLKVIDVITSAGSYSLRYLPIRQRGLDLKVKDLSLQELSSILGLIEWVGLGRHLYAIRQVNIALPVLENNEFIIPSNDLAFINLVTCKTREIRVGTKLAATPPEIKTVPGAGSNSLVGEDHKTAN